MQFELHRRRLKDIMKNRSNRIDQTAPKSMPANRAKIIRAR